MPGILTGLAAVITAVTGLIVAFNHTGNRNDAVPTTAASADSRVSSRGASTEAREIPLPSLSRVRLAGGDAVITILSAELEPIDSQRRSLKFRVRHLNAGRYDANFWSSSYRLVVDDVPRAPTNLLDEVVAGNSAKEGEVIFELPVSAKQVVLQVSFGDDTSRLPFALP